ncbi:MAG TPA: cysteine desulfurase [Fusobacteriaceae bacterium]|nr:cysteine desulfurase [Fusobacteriaceae bacterium]
MYYFDNASTTFPKVEAVYGKTMEIYKNLGVNFSRNRSNKSKEANDIKKKLIQNLKMIFSSNGKIILNSSATSSLNEILRGVDYKKIKNVYISPFEHNAVYRTIKDLQDIYKFNLNILKFNDFDLDKEHMELQFMSQNPDLIISTHASNVFGNILDVKSIFKEGKRYNSITVLDGAQTSGLLDFSKISNLCDFIVFAGHKTLYGPSGIGGYLYNNKEIILKPLLYGGTGIKSEDIHMPEDIPQRYEAGSPNLVGMIGLKLSTDWILEIGIKNIRKKEKENYKRLVELLEEYDYDISFEIAKKM